jgi:hypothetical protein
MEDRRNARFAEADFSGARFHGVILQDVRITDALIFGLELSGLVGRLTVNGVDVGPYVEAELNKRHPERVLLSRPDPDGLREAWAMVEQHAAATVDRARALPPDLLDERVDDEWSYLETLRHLVFATDRWITGPVLGEPEPFHRLGRPNDPLDEIPPGLFDLDARPSLDEVLAVRRERMDRVAALVGDIDPATLTRDVDSPNGGQTKVVSCIHVVLREEWAHDQYARRDLAILESRRA